MLNSEMRCIRKKKNQVLNIYRTQSSNVYVVQGIIDGKAPAVIQNITISSQGTV